MRFFPLALLALAGAVLGGCVASQSVEIYPESHFIHPNSNVTKLGPVRSTTRSSVQVFVPSGPRTPATDRKLYQDALAQESEAEAIVDAVLVARQYFLPLWFLPVFWTTYDFQGTAARMEVGEQYLR